MIKHLPNIIALLVIYIAVVMNWQWVWGVLFLMWTVPALYSGRVHLISPVEKKANPVLFWTIVLTWIGLSLYLIFTDLIPFLGALS